MNTVLKVIRNSCRGHVLQSLRCSTLQTQGKFPAYLSQQSVTSLAIHQTRAFSLTNISQSAAEHSEHSHTNIWKAERVLSAGLVGLLPLAIAFPNPPLDFALAVVLTAHIHWGVESIVVDYIRPSIVGVTMSRMTIAAVYAFSLLTVGGLFYFNYNDVGLSQAIRMLWKL